MSTSTEPKRTTPLLPPEERFWKRYSAHGEMPLSTTASVTLHVLVLGVMLLFGAAITRLFFDPTRSLPIEPVRLDVSDEEPGGSSKGVGAGDGPDRIEDTGSTEKTGGNDPLSKEQPMTQLQPLSPVERNVVKQEFDDSTSRYLAQNETAAVASVMRLAQSTRNKLALADSRRAPGGGKGGVGQGGKGTGTGKGVGAGKGNAPKATLSQREKRMLRWNMRFPANSGEEYVRQLAGLGAILAIPINEGGVQQFKVVRELLRRPAPLLDEDISKIQRIYWVDDKARSVNDVMRALRAPYTPSRFIAFMPVELEKQLFEMEKAHMRARYGTFNESRIYETVFRVQPGPGGRVRPVLLHMTLKGPGQR